MTFSHGELCHLPVSLLVLFPNSDLRVYNMAQPMSTRENVPVTFDEMIARKRTDRQYQAILSGFKYDGQECPVSVYCPSEGPKFQDGNHRLAAALELGFETLWVDWYGVRSFEQWACTEDGVRVLEQVEKGLPTTVPTW